VLQLTWKIGILASVWSVFVGFWIAAWFIYKKPEPGKKREGSFSFAGFVVMISLIIAYLFFDYFLMKPELPPTYKYCIDLISIVILIFGFSLAVWARIMLASSWSGLPAFIEGQPIVSEGPYALVRHPIYIGVTAMLWGSFFVGEFFLFFLLAALGTVILYWKAKIEEALLLKYRGEGYRAYMDKVPGLFAPLFYKMFLASRKMEK